MSNATLNAVPSPPQPADVVENPTLGGYVDALYACDELLHKETSLERRMEIERCRAFFLSVIDAIEGSEGMAAPPAPPPQPQMGMPPQPQPAPPPAASPPPGPPPGGPADASGPMDQGAPLPAMAG